MSDIINETEVLVANYLKNQSITLDPIHTTEAVQSNEVWKHDKFLVNLTAANGTLVTFDYSTGLGHRVSVRDGNNGRFATMSPKQVRWLKSASEKLGYTNFKKEAVNIVQDYSGFARPKIMHRIVRQWIIKPSQASILYCLLSDSRLAIGSFNDYCDELGANNDSIKERETFEACIRSERKLKKVFNPDQIEELTKLLEDY